MSTEPKQSRLQNLEVEFLELSDTELEAIAGGKFNPLDIVTKPVRRVVRTVGGIFGGGRRPSSPSGGGVPMAPMGGGYSPMGYRPGGMTIGQMFDIFLSRFMA